MKLSVSLTEADVAVPEYAHTFGLSSRSAALQQAIRLLRHTELKQDCALAWDELESSGEQALWEGVVADGLAMHRGEIRPVDLEQREVVKRTSAAPGSS